MDKNVQPVSFSRLPRDQKIKLIAGQSQLDENDVALLTEFWPDQLRSFQSLENVSENVISHFHLPFAIAPGFLINGRQYFVPMVTEESSVVAATSSAAKFWFSNGGFSTRILGMIKIGQIHFKWTGSWTKLEDHNAGIREALIASTRDYLANMSYRGGGIKKIEFINHSDKLPDYFQVRVSFDTVDAMGANLINTCLESMARTLKEYFYRHFQGEEKNCNIIMAILSNHTPECLVECTVECSLEALQAVSRDLPALTFAQQFEQAISIAQADIYRAATHNKGIMNGIDAVLIATGNDFRAVEAGIHSYAARDGIYKGLTHIRIGPETFTLALTVPVTIGTVGGLTSLHPMVRTALRILRNPSARELMQIVAATGLASNFSAIRALITSGIQRGHMKLHLQNILTALSATESEKLKAVNYFENRTVSFRDVETFLLNQRK